MNRFVAGPGDFADPSGEPRIETLADLLAHLDVADAPPAAQRVAVTFWLNEGAAPSPLLAADLAAAGYEIRRLPGADRTAPAARRPG